ncbi:hypothetical protein AX17_002675 [Amanita inopinata Kibby_2008]|nr:hypothetical protein AX17_002675 [Amanita inopinata Kibby_2008]
MSSIIQFLIRLYKAFNPPEQQPPYGTTPIKFGILGTAAIAPLALISPAKNHPEVVVHAVAARDKERAEAFAKKYHISKAYGGSNGYQELIDDPEIDAIYNPLPNSLHYEWTMKALAAGKHVLLEKPSSNSAEETRKMYELAESKGLILLEALHYRFHPAVQRVKAIIDGGDLGAIKHIEVTLVIPAGIFKSDNIKFSYDLGKGALMGMGCYTLHCIRYLSSSNPEGVEFVTTYPHYPRSATASFVPNVDRGALVALNLPRDASAMLQCDLGVPPKFGIIPTLPKCRVRVECEGGSVELYNFALPTVYHYITIDRRGQKPVTEKAYTFAQAKMEGKGEDWWTTYRYQLEAFVDKLRGRVPQTWLDKEDAVSNIGWIERIYELSGLGLRPKSTFVPS